MEKKQVSVCFSPFLYPLFRNDEAVVVVVDVLRATSAMVTGFDNGVKAMVPVAGIEEALSYKSQGFLVAGERNGEKQEGFDFGNSPFSYVREVVEGRKVAISTTNGTQAIVAAKDAYKLVIGSFLNLSAMRDFLVEQKRDVIVLCAGWKNRFNLEDSLFGGALAEQLLRSGAFDVQCDSALAAMHLYERAKLDMNGYLANSSHRKRLKHLNLAEDIAYCLSIDICKSIPELKNGELVWETN
ncbi:MAG: 2-phosphosulfolactate phosphatase [Bacteroidia bacterium]|nr:2-phosphosulfolactate phosphatase [Bacteroidia bacterium]